MTHTLRWGLLAAGNIARAFAAGLAQTNSGIAHAVASRDRDRARAFADELGIPKSYGSYDDMLADPEIDAVYVATPHPMHADWVVRAARAGKHILCEKPLAMNQWDAETAIAAARRSDVFLMEAFMYRCTPQTAKLAELVRDGAVGEVRTIDASFAFQCAYNLESRLLDANLGGGGILDVGCYPVSMSRLLAGAAAGEEYADPIEVHGLAHIGEESHVDEWAVAQLKFEGGILARLSTGVQVSQDNRVVVHGSQGRIEVPDPWFCHGREAGRSTIHLARGGGDTEEITVACDRGIYACEADVVAAHIEARQGPAPAMSWGDSLGQARTIDRWREAIGLSYPCETAAGYARPVGQLPLQVRTPNRMPYGEVPGLGKKTSRMVMGTMAAGSSAHATALYDDYFARGGTAWDTAYIYGGGKSEILLGQWIASRGVRDEVTVIVKGAHSPHCNPQALVSQFDESLERLQLDYADLYFMHRDDPDVPIGEFVDVMDGLRQEGRIRVFGGSNWTLERVAAANEYAAAHGKTGFGALSNNFSLAQMVSPLWGIEVTSARPEYRAWHEATQTPCFAWSSQARGFFDPSRAGRDIDNPDLADFWYSEENFQRQDRVIALAGKRDCHPMAVASAYVMAQSFPIFALVGPATLEESERTFAALDVELTDDEVRWLNLES